MTNSLLKNPLIIFVSAFLLCVLSRPAWAAPRPGWEAEIIREILWDKIVNLPAGKRLKTGIVLSGGGARGFAHVGVLEALEAANLPVDCVAGVSMGAVLGAFYSSGFGVADLWKFARETDVKNVSKDFRGLSFLNLLIKDSFSNPKHITSFINSRLAGREFGDLKTPFACAAMDFKTGEKIIFRKGNLAMAVRASVNLPGIFEPIKYRHRYLVDGGVVDFLPVDLARLLGAEWIFSSWVEGGRDELPRNVFSSFLRVIDIRGEKLAQSSAEKSDFTVKVKSDNIGIADFGKCLEAGEKGLLATHGKIDAIREDYILKNFSKLRGRLND